MKTRLDLLLAARHPDLSRSRLKSYIEQGRVTLAGVPLLKPAAQLDPDAPVVLDLPPPVPPDQLVPLDLPLTILYEDPYILVIDKPPGLVVHPAPGHDQDTLVNALLAHCHDLQGIGNVLRPGIVHRLDADTSGCLVVAKTESAFLSLSAQFAAHTPRKTYLALCWGIPSPPSGTLSAPLGRSPVNRKRQAILPVADGGRPALTRYATLATGPSASLLALRIETGRTHQIRVHLSALLHCPICGDPLYGGTRETVPPRPFMPPRQMLHAYALALRHPNANTPLAFRSPLPHDFLEALPRLLPDFDPATLPDRLAAAFPASPPP